jgi:hypothetical protein
MPQGQRVALARRTKLGDDGNQIAPLPIAASRTVALGGMVATVGFPDIGLQGFAPNEGDRWRVAGDVISRHLSLVTRHTSGVAGKCELRGQEQSAVELPRIGAGSFAQTQSAGHG